MEIQEIKSKLTLAVVLNYYHLKPDKNLRLNCPFHEDKTPSLQLYYKTHTCFCFSSNCKTHGKAMDVIDFIMHKENITKHEALMKAKDMIGVAKPSISKDIIINPRKLGGQAILTKYYQSSIQSMARSKKGKVYVESRNLDYKNLGIGFCGYDVGKTWNKDLQTSAEKLGLFNIKNCIIFPTKNKAGQIESIYGRSVSSNPKVRHFYLQGGFKGLYPSYPKVETKTLILTESIIDAASIKQYLPSLQIGNDWSVLAMYGTNGFTSEHIEAVSQLKELEEIILFFDGDEAGKAAINKYKKLLSELRSDIEISYVETPEGEDVNSLLQSHEAKVLNHLIENRITTNSVQ